MTASSLDAAHVRALLHYLSWTNQIFSLATWVNDQRTWLSVRQLASGCGGIEGDQKFTPRGHPLYP